MTIRISCNLWLSRVKELKEKLAQRTATVAQLIGKDTGNAALSKAKPVDEPEQKIVEYLDPRIRLIFNPQKYYVNCSWYNRFRNETMSMV